MWNTIRLKIPQSIVVLSLIFSGISCIPSLLRSYAEDQYPEFVNDTASKKKLPEWVEKERKDFQTKYDKNKDGKLSPQEIYRWIVPEDFDKAVKEAKHLIEKADTDKVCFDATSLALGLPLRIMGHRECSCFYFLYACLLFILTSLVFDMHATVLGLPSAFRRPLAGHGKRKGGAFMAGNWTTVLLEEARQERRWALGFGWSQRMADAEQFRPCGHRG